jgi:hypothetical protein
VTVSGDATVATCPQCASPLAAEDQFCESCGAAVGAGTAPVADTAPDERPPGLDSTRTRLIIPAPSEPVAEVVRHCASCEGVVDESGYCTVCGIKAVAERDHFRETPSPWTGGVCDRGRRHHRNEDAAALGLTAEGYPVRLNHRWSRGAVAATMKNGNPTVVTSSPSSQGLGFASGGNDRAASSATPKGSGASATSNRTTCSATWRRTPSRVAVACA